MLVKEPPRNGLAFEASADLLVQPGKARDLDAPAAGLLQLEFLSFPLFGVVGGRSEWPHYSKSDAGILVLLKGLLCRSVEFVRHRVVIIEKIHIACLDIFFARKIDCKISNSAGPATGRIGFFK